MRYKEYKFNTPFYSLIDVQCQKLIDIITEYNPLKICLLGIGSQSEIFEQYVELNSDKNIKLSLIDTIKEESFFKNEDIDMTNIITFPIIENTNITIGNTEYSNINKYDGLENWLQNQDKFDFIFIDGPFGFGDRESYDYSRIQTISFIELNKIEDNCILIFHDSERNNAKTTLIKFEELLTSNNFTFEKEIFNINLPKEMTIYTINKVNE